MKRVCWSLVIAPLLLLSRSEPARADVQQLGDPFAWLEDLRSPRALDWVSAHTTTTLGELSKSPEYPALFADIKRVLDSREVIDYPQIVGERIYNLLRDEQHPRGLWRRTTWEGYLNGSPHWESVFDFDSLARIGVARNFIAAECIKPANRFCLLELTADGSDSTDLRELDVDARQFVAVGDYLPETIQKATALARTEMPLVESTPAEFARRVQAIRLPPGEALRKYYSDADGDLYMVRDQVVVYLHRAWTIGENTWPAGSIIATSLKDFVSLKRDLRMVMKPGSRERIESVHATRDFLVVDVLNNVCSELRRYRHDNNRWAYERVRIPKLGSVDVISTSTETNRFFFSYTSFVQPTTLYVADDDGRAKEIKRLPASFNAQDVVVDQSEATSRDGTKIPFFIVHRSELRRDGNNPTLLYAYGGFELASAPGYGTAVGPAWIGRGGVYVVANIRGGGEFGPEWHTAAIRENRQRVYEDFSAVAEELVKQRITSPANLGIIGASNGGLLIGVAFTQRPDLYGAAVVQSPLLDMRRYTHLLGGASWISEYGDPDKPEEWAYISKYSPYENLRPATNYPAVLFETNRSDERVHPSHARKMAAKMESMGLAVYYFENVNGGHHSGLTNEEKARTSALAFSFLWEHLRPNGRQSSF